MVQKRTPVSRRYTVEEDNEVAHESDVSDDEGQGRYGLRLRTPESYRSHSTQRVQLPPDDDHAPPPTVPSEQASAKRRILSAYLELAPMRVLDTFIMRLAHWVTAIKRTHILIFLVFGCLILSLVVSYYDLDKCQNLSSEDETKLLVTLDYLKNNFTNQNKNLWKVLLDGVLTISKCEHKCPRAILLLSERNAEHTSKCLVKKVSEKIAHFLPNKNFLQMTWKGKQLDCNDCTSELRSQLGRYSPIVIEELENITPNAAQALHYICDEDDTHYGKNLYLLTMSVERNQKGRNVDEIAQSALTSLLKDKMTPDNINALIPRLTGQVVFIEPEPESNLKNC